jgi:hypothetical protein
MNPKEAAMNDDWRDALMRRYPHLFGQSGYPTVGDGWRDLLERALQRFETVVVFEPAGSWVRITQIAEKYGTLRLDFGNSPDFTAAGLDMIDEVVDLAEARSACTCEECGAHGRLHDRGGWLITRCDDHADGEPVPIRPGWEDLHVKTIHRGETRVVLCRLYDRDIDVFDAAPLPPDFDEGD